MADRTLKRNLIVANLAAIALSASLVGCLTDTDLGTAQPRCAPLENFRVVNNMLERRCGTLDCHGDLARPFIVFGQNGLRRPGGQELANDRDAYFTGGVEPTLDYEVQGTYQSACGLEPEKMDAVVKGAEAPESLTLIRKPRLDEKHKGGRLWNGGTVKGDRCLVAWVSGTVEAEPCITELQAP